MFKYLIDLTFYAGSDDKEDTDRDIFIFYSNEEISKQKMSNIFKETNKLLDCYNEEKVFPISYNDGLNISTLIQGVSLYTNSLIQRIGENRKIDSIDAYYKIEQWQ